MSRRLAALLLLAASGAVQAFFINPTMYIGEYVNEITGHYVLLDPDEAYKVLNGSAGPGWTTTGVYFGVLNLNYSSPEQKQVCRFYSPVNNSHFFTSDAVECAFLRNTPGEWIYEKNAFTVYAGGPRCGTGYSPVYRLYNNRQAVHDANHRFTPDPAIRAEMIALGWKDEGVAFCAFGWGTRPEKSFQVYADSIRDAAACESRVGGCVRLGQLAAMPNHVPGFIQNPPNLSTPNPALDRAGEISGGKNTDLFTAQSPADPQAFAAHSFVQMYTPYATPALAVHVNGRDRLSGPYASISPMYQLDGTLFPWKSARHRTLVASFYMRVPTIARADAASHAYGVLMLQFADAASGHSFYATVQVYGTVAPSDFAARDEITGRPIVSTVFRDTPAFGTRLAGDFAACEAGKACIAADRFYQFRIVDSDFEKILAEARTIDPQLSPDISRYFVEQVSLRNETYRDAEIGATMAALGLDVWY